MSVGSIALGLAHQSLADKIYEELRERIIVGRLAPEERLRERGIAEELEVSRIPVREALQRLEAEGFIANLPRRGAVVTRLNYGDVVELFDLRSSLEPLAARLAAQRVALGASPQVLLDAYDTAEAARLSGNATAIAIANSDLHEVVVRLSGNQMLISIMGPIHGQVRRLFNITSDRDPALQADEHKDLCKAIAAGDSDRASQLAYDHVEHGRAESLVMFKTPTP